MPFDQISTMKRLVLSLLGPLLLAAASPACADETPIRFNRDIRPILADRCFQCHGPDGTQRQADLRLDQRDTATADRDGLFAIKPGDPDHSEILSRITADDDSLKMPPPELGKPLSPTEVEQIRRWIAGGAEFEPFWSFLAPKRHATPALKNSEWIRRPLDRWILSKLEAEGLTPSPDASREALIRRVSLDLTGLPPTETELDEFLADEAPDAYERLVDRLLASPEFGERMTQFWLDAARYADTNGYFTDNERTMWRWREQVIAAFNANQPFDEFTIEQLAGDLLPEPTVEQLIASGFNRNHTTNNETGSIDEEFRISYMMDRMETTGTVWLGLTFNCARCHTHKFDPIEHREYYQMLAFFNQGPEKGVIGGEGNSDPLISTPTEYQQTRLEQLKVEKEQAAAKWGAIESEVRTAMSNWLENAETQLPALPTRNLLARYSFEEDLPTDASAVALSVPVEGASTVATDRASQLIAAGQKGAVTYGDAIRGRGARFDTYGHCETVDNSAFDFERTDAFTVGGWMMPASASAGCVYSKIDDDQFLRGFDLVIEKGKAAFHLNHRAESDAIQVKSGLPIAVNQWQHVVVTYDGSQRAAGVRMYVNGEPIPTLIQFDRLESTIRNAQPFRLGRRSDSLAFNGMVDEICLFDRELAPDEIANWAASEELHSILAREANDRSQHQTDRLLRYFLRSSSDEWRSTYQKFTTTTAEYQNLDKQLPTTMVMKDQEEYRQTFVLSRGQYDQPTDPVDPGVPGVLAPFPSSEGVNEKPADRLTLARWLVSPEQTLTPRVIVNRYWQQVFGTGIVKSVNDFGVQGEWPSHLELLDELAVDFVESGWDVKQLFRTIVTSATYRQSSQVSPALQQRDPENRWLARGPRFRLDAEAVRDQALAASGLLVRRLGGPSVMPYQPDGLWEAVSYNGDQSYNQDHGNNLYRRSMYTFWKRQSPPPAILAWDGPTRETCVVLRSRTNTPLQALVLSNDITYVEAARVWAGEVMSSNDVSPRKWIDRAFRQIMCRRPDDAELSLLISLYDEQLAEFQQHPEDVEPLLVVGEYQLDGTQINRSKWAALTTVMQVLLNLDETVTKE
ncbi:MAG: DUF1553 domain-containing protein [Planctomycetota bacterium]|nr:DUF1553 domain-containing protein [Planctomycetota bacterium]MDA1213826.1 DUF1553 domain-containing protein [Planctomycetota bacterium]